MIHGFLVTMMSIGVAFAQTDRPAKDDLREIFDARVLTIRGLAEDLRSGALLEDFREKSTLTTLRVGVVGAATIEAMAMLSYDLRLIANVAEDLSLTVRLTWLQNALKQDLRRLFTSSLGTEAQALEVVRIMRRGSALAGRIALLGERQLAVRAAREGLILRRATAWDSAHFFRWLGFVALASELTSASDNPEIALRDNPWLILNYGTDTQLEGFRRSLLLDEINDSLLALETTLRLMGAGGAVAAEIDAMESKRDDRSELERQIRVPFVSMGSKNEKSTLGFALVNYVPSHRSAAITDVILRYRCLSGPDASDRTEHDDAIDGSLLRTLVATPPTKEAPVGAADLETQAVSICGQRTTIALGLTAGADRTWIEARLMRSDGSFLNSREDSF